MGKVLVDRELLELCDQEIEDVDYPGYCALLSVPQHREDVWKPEQV